jgi:hypothetical protein
MTWSYVAVGAGTLIGGYLSGEATKSAAKSAAGAQTGFAQMGIEETRRQFDEIQKMLMPYANAGQSSIAAQQALLGLAGPEAQATAMEELQKSPAFTALTAQGENAILQSASATGGLRGGNVQGALAQFRPKLLSDVIQQRFQNLQSVTSTGATAASSLGGFGSQASQQIAQLMGQQGSAQAGSALAQGQANAGMGSSIGSLIGMFGGASMGSGGF